MSGSRYVLVIPDADKPTPRDPGFKPGGIRARAYRPVSNSRLGEAQANQRWRVSSGDQERFDRIRAALEQEKLCQESENEMLSIESSPAPATSSWDDAGILSANRST